MTKSLTVLQLANRCRAEAERYQRTQETDEEYCFELFRRALVEQNQDAWEAIYDQYENLVATWIYQYHRFSQTDEEIEFFINDAFARLWKYAAKPNKADQFEALGQFLNYLKMCVGSSVENYLRKKKKDALRASVPLESYDQPEPSPRIQAEHNLLWDKIRDILRDTIQDEQEQLVAQESWIYGLAPRQIQQRYETIFTDAAQVSQIKRNLLRRLKRHPKIKNLSQA